MEFSQREIRSVLNVSLPNSNVAIFCVGQNDGKQRRCANKESVYLYDLPFVASGPCARDEVECFWQNPQNNYSNPAQRE